MAEIDLAEASIGELQIGGGQARRLTFFVLCTFIHTFCSGKPEVKNQGNAEKSGAD